MLAFQTLDLERRLTQIRTAAEISRTLGSILDPQELLQRVVDLIKERFDLYYVGVFQVDENRRFAQLVAVEQPDIISLQEVQAKQVKALQVAGYRTIAGPNANCVFFRFGNALLTKHRITKH